MNVLDRCDYRTYEDSLLAELAKDSNHELAIAIGERVSTLAQEVEEANSEASRAEKERERLENRLKAVVDKLEALRDTELSSLLEDLDRLTEYARGGL